VSDFSSERVLPANTDRFFEAEPPRDPLALQRPAGVGASYSHAWEQLKRYFWPLLLMGLVALIVSLVVGFVTGAIGGVLDAALGTRFFSSLAGLISQFVVTVPLTYGGFYVYLKAARDERPEVSDLFVPYQRAFFNSVVANILLTLIVVVGTFLFIIPGIIAGVRLSFAPLLVVDEGYGPVEAIGESWRRTHGYFWTIFLTGLLGVPVVLVGLLLFVVGVIPAGMWVYLAFTSLYAAITARTRDESHAPAFA